MFGQFLKEKNSKKIVSKICKQTPRLLLGTIRFEIKKTLKDDFYYKQNNVQTYFIFSHLTSSYFGYRFTSFPIFLSL